MTIPFDVDPVAILIPMQAEISRWHLIDVEHGLTTCGLFLSQGSERRPFSQVPEKRRCEVCIREFGERVVQESS